LCVQDSAILINYLNLVSCLVFNQIASLAQQSALVKQNLTLPLTKARQHAKYSIKRSILGWPIPLPLHPAVNSVSK
jgi:hypothetical protein